MPRFALCWPRPSVAVLLLLAGAIISGLVQRNMAMGMALPGFSLCWPACEEEHSGSSLSPTCSSVLHQVRSGVVAGGGEAVVVSPQVIFASQCSPSTLVAA